MPAWTWDAAQHIGLDEITTTSGPGPSWLLNSINGAPAADIYHCNSVAVDEDASSPYFGDVLVSMRNVNAVFLGGAMATEIELAMDEHAAQEALVA